jgi:hypothetical protein
VVQGDRVVASESARRTVTMARIVIIATLLASSVASAQDSRSSVVLTTKHFVFHSDIATNVHDALIVAATSQRAKQSEAFAAGAEKACFDGLPAADRSQWARAVDYYAAGKSTNFQRLLMRLDLAGLLRRDGPGDAATWQLLDEVAAIRMAATPAYRQCWWAAQDALNRAWVARLEPLLAQYESTLGEQLPRLYQVPWVGLPFRVDVVENGSALGADSVGPGGDTTLHVLVSSENADNQDRAALEVMFHEASHALTRTNSPLSVALASAVKESGATPPRIPILHAVHFFITGEAVRRVFAQTGGVPYTPYLYSLKMFGDPFREAAARIWPAYIDGKRGMPQAAEDLVRALAMQ